MNSESGLYPSVRVWNTGSGAVGWRLTVKIDDATRIAQLLSHFSIIALGYLTYMICFTIYYYFAASKYSDSEVTVFDDQLHTLAANERRPAGLLFSIAEISYNYAKDSRKSSRRVSIFSKLLPAYLLVCTLSIAIEGILIYAIPKLTNAATAVPLRGTHCGVLTKARDGPLNGKISTNLATRSKRQADNFGQCQRVGSPYPSDSYYDYQDEYRCQGPLGGAISIFADVRSNYCWFQDEYLVEKPKNNLCYRGVNNTIRLTASVGARDMGLLVRDPKDDIKLVTTTTCSYLNATKYSETISGTRLTEPSPDTIGNLPSFVYYYGDFMGSNRTFTLNTAWLRVPQYGYNFVQDRQTVGGDVGWDRDELFRISEDANGYGRGATSVSLLGVHVGGVPTNSSAFRNKDIGYGVDDECKTKERCEAVRGTVGIACLESYDLWYIDNAGHPDSIGGADIAPYADTGVPGKFTSQSDLQFSRRFGGIYAPLMLAEVTQVPAMVSAMQTLQGAAVKAQDTLRADVQTVPDLRMNDELVRWFGTSIMNQLYYAQYVSGVDNYVHGLEFRDFSELSICERTLFKSQAYTAVNIVGIALFLIFGLIIIVLPSLFDFIVKNSAISRSTSLKAAYIKHNMHSALSLHRIAVERSWKDDDRAGVHGFHGSRLSTQDVYTRKLASKKPLYRGDRTVSYGIEALQLRGSDDVLDEARSKGGVTGRVRHMNSGYSIRKLNPTMTSDWPEGPEMSLDSNAVKELFK